jgi:hypothetical protein
MTRTPFLLGCLVTLLFFFAASRFRLSIPHQTDSSADAAVDGGASHDWSAMFKGTTNTRAQPATAAVLTEISNGAPFVFQRTINSRPRALLVVGNAYSQCFWRCVLHSFCTSCIITSAHGCSHAGTDWFVKSSSCPSCIGLPIERTIAEASLAHGYAVLAPTSQDRQSGCWSPADVPLVVNTIKHVLTHEAFVRPAQSTDTTKMTAAEAKSLPVVLLGASSGGAFVAPLALAARDAGLIVAALCVQIAAPQVPGEMLSGVPPMLFVHMQRDAMTADRIAAVMQQRQAAGIKTDQQRVQPPLPIQADFFQRHKHLNRAESSRLVESLTKAGMLHKETRQLTCNPRAAFMPFKLEAGPCDDWPKLAKQAVQHKHDQYQPDQSGVSELLNMAYAEHELTNAFFADTLEFFDQHIKALGQ